jgi:hypothetical protein
MKVIGRRVCALSWLARMLYHMAFDLSNHLFWHSPKGDTSHAFITESQREEKQKMTFIYEMLIRIDLGSLTLV